jgi:serine-type D-Ala-D-Ala carboxypeptidase/endopeptidase (penicillin-binding protein 4)
MVLIFAKRLIRDSAIAGFSILFAGSLFATGLAPSQAGGMPLPQWLQSAGLQAKQVGVVVWDVAADAPAFLSNAEEPLNPASTMKVLTTYAALSLLGPAYRWNTHFFLSKPLIGDVLPGDLIIKGGGDPKMVIEDMQELVLRLRQKGLRDIQGDVLLDASIYDVGEQSVDPFDGDPTQPYNVRPNAALMNFKASNFIVSPGSQGLSVRLDPELADVAIEVDVKLIAGPCRHGAAGLSIRDVGQAQAARILVSGVYSSACGEQSNYVSVLTHQQFIHSFFKAAWIAAGGRYAGQTRFVKDFVPKTLKPWFVWESPRTLADVVRDVNKFSNNVMARQLLLQVSYEMTKLPATPERARNAVQIWLKNRGLHFPEMHIENGSGLSRTERISALHLATLLKNASTSAVGPLLKDSFPVVGVDGTMRSRLGRDPIAGSAWIKTGSLVAVRSIAGYVKSASGRELVVVVLVNGPKAEASQALQDQILKWVYLRF